MNTTFDIKGSINKNSWWNVGCVGTRVERKRKKSVNVIFKIESLLTFYQVRVVPRICFLFDLSGALSTFNSADV